MKLNGMGIGHGESEGEVLQVERPISFLGGVEPKTGAVLDRESGKLGESVADKILAFPHGKGSTVGSYVIYQLKKSGAAPAAIVNQKADPIIATGAIISEIPMLSEIPTEILWDGDRAVVNADDGYLDLPDVMENPVVTGILRKGDKILIMKRSNEVGSFQGRWAGISGGVLDAEKPEDAMVREIEEESGLGRESYRLSVTGSPIFARKDTRVWKVFPFLLDIIEGEVSLDWEHDEFQWITVDDLDSYETVPRLENVIDHLLKIERVQKKRVCD